MFGSMTFLVDVWKSNRVAAEDEFYSDKPTREGIPLSMWRATREEIERHADTE